jgi:hypothetical protein
LIKSGVVFFTDLFYLAFLFSKMSEKKTEVLHRRADKSSNIVAWKKSMILSLMALKNKAAPFFRGDQPQFEYPNEVHLDPPDAPPEDADHWRCG